MLKALKLSKEHKEKIKRAMNDPKMKKRISKKLKEYYKKYIPPRLGKHQSEEAKQKIRKSKWKGGKKSYWYELSRKVWEEHHNRKIPKGGVIHHKDGDYKNINPKNLELIASSSRHIRWHAQLRRLKERSKQFLKTI